MPRITYIEPNGTSRTVEVESGATVMEGAIDNGIDGIVAACGGSCACSTCHVHVDDSWTEKVGKPHTAEEDTLTLALDVKETSRLSCQITVGDHLDGLVVRVADEQA